MKNLNQTNDIDLDIMNLIKLIPQDDFNSCVYLRCNHSDNEIHLFYQLKGTNELIHQSLSEIMIKNKDFKFILFNSLLVYFYDHKKEWIKFNKMLSKNE